MANKLLARLAKGPMICAEGYLFELERRGYVSVGPWVPEAVLNEPDAVKQLHREFVRAGSDVIQAFTYYSHRQKMRTIGKEDLLETINRKALDLAFEVRDEMQPKVDFDLFVAGNICASGIYKEGDAELDAYVTSMMDEQCEWAKDANVDYMIGETFDFVKEGLLATKVCLKHGLPNVITLQPHRNEFSREGIHLADGCKMLKDAGADVVGLNCSCGPSTMIPLLESIRGKVDGYVAALPVGYNTTPEYPTMTSFTTENDRKFLDIDGHTCTRFHFSEFGERCLEMDVTYLGCCCGGAPHHVRAMAEAIGRKPISSSFSPDMSKHIWFGKTGNEHLCEENLVWKENM